MTTAATALPLLALRITAGPVELRGITDDLLGPLADLATDIHDPDFMPFGFPWSLTPAPDMPRNVAQYHWGKRASFSPAQWNADFAVFYDGELVGSQGFSTKDYLIIRGGETGSWLGRRFQGRGIGTAMRQVICAFIFDHLDARVHHLKRLLGQPGVPRRQQEDRLHRQRRRPASTASASPRSCAASSSNPRT